MTPLTITLTTLHVLASVMAGEAEILGDEGMLGVGHIALNRVDDPAFSNTLEKVLAVGAGFAGRVSQPSAHHVALASYVLTESDWTDGMLYAYSLQDRKRLLYPPGDLVIGEGTYQLHLYKAWPGLRKLPTRHRLRSPVNIQQ